MGRDDETQVGVAVDVVEENLLVGGPCAAGHEDGVPLGEAFDEREGARGATDVGPVTVTLSFTPMRESSLTERRF